MKQQEKKEPWTREKGKLVTFLGLLILGFALTVLGIHKSIQSCCPTRNFTSKEKEGIPMMKSTQKTLSNQGTSTSEKSQNFPSSTQVVKVPTGCKESGNPEKFNQNQSSFYTCSEGTQVKVLLGSKYETVIDTETGIEVKTEEMQSQLQQKEGESSIVEAEGESSIVEEQEEKSIIEDQDDPPSMIKDGEFPKENIKSLNLSKISANPQSSNKSISLEGHKSQSLINQFQELEQQEEEQEE